MPDRVTSPAQSDLLVFATRFDFPGPDMLMPISVELTCRAGEGPHKPTHDTWAVRCMGRCLNSEGEWEFEPIPSSRDDELFARTRWTRDEALDRAEQMASKPNYRGWPA